MIRTRDRIDFSKVEDVEIDGIDFRDAPDFCDAFISSATYQGRDATEEELDLMNDDSDFVYECVMDELY